MRKIVLMSVLTLTVLSGCNGSNEESDLSESINEKTELPSNPEIKTDYGQIGEYQTMDEYYLDVNGDKVWHGYRKNLYPTLRPKTVSFYEHGELFWTETYDEVGNVLSSNR